MQLILDGAAAGRGTRPQQRRWSRSTQNHVLIFACPLWHESAPTHITRTHAQLDQPKDTHAHTNNNHT